MPGTKDDSKAKRYQDEEKYVLDAVGEVLRDSADVVDKPIGIYVGGAPGSGKTVTIINAQQDRFDAEGGIIVIDPDAIRPAFPAAQEEMQEGTAFSNEAYTASAVVSFKLAIGFAGESRNFLRDGTLSNGDYLIPEIERVTGEFNYAVEVHCMVPPPALSWARTVMRREATTETGEPGRAVDREYHDSAIEGLRQTADQIYNMNLAQRFVLYDGRGKTLLDRQMGEDGKFVTIVGQRPESESLSATISHYQQNPTALDLVDTADAWRRALGSLARDREDDRPVTESERAVVAREWVRAAREMLGNREAVALAQQNDALWGDTQAHGRSVLLHVLGAWKRAPGDAAAAWPEHAEVLHMLDARLEKRLADQPEFAAAMHRDWLVMQISRADARRAAAETAPTPALSKEPPAAER